MGTVLAVSTSVINPETEATEILLAGTKVPTWAQGLVGEHCLTDVPDDEPAAPVKPGPKDSAAKWHAYAEATGVDIPDGATKADVIELVEATEGE